MQQEARRGTIPRLFFFPAILDILETGGLPMIGNILLAAAVAALFAVCHHRVMTAPWHMCVRSTKGLV